LNLILIPKWQAVGASITVVATSILLLILGLIQVPKIIAYQPKRILKVLGKSLTASLVMMILIIYLKYYLSVFIIVPLAGSLYFAILFFLKGFKKEDVISIYQSFIKRPNSNISTTENL
jgi:O-antigen/teichoic acid export membrane protein